MEKAYKTKYQSPEIIEQDFVVESGIAESSIIDSRVFDTGTIIYDNFAGENFWK